MNEYGAKLMSMGCLVEAPTCSICDKVVSTCEHTRPGKCDCDPDGQYECHGQGSCGAYDIPMFPMLVSVSLVRAPKCDDCGETMVVASNTEWMCQEAECEAKGIPRDVGIYPVQEVRGS